MSSLDILGMIANGLPWLAIAFICIHYRVRRAEWQRKKRLGLRDCGFCPSFKAMSLAAQSFEAFYRPSIVLRLEVEQDESAEEDESGEPEPPIAHFNRQLRRIRSGEKIDTLVWRLE
jgi:hypothetical protein